MGLMRLILIGIIIWLVWRGVAGNRERTAVKRQTRPQVGQMVRCEYCGLFLPADEAYHDGSRTFCCEAHRRHAARAGGDR